MQISCGVFCSLAVKLNTRSGNFFRSALTGEFTLKAAISMQVDSSLQKLVSVHAIQCIYHELIQDLRWFRGIYSSGHQED